jgi:hypothetical protein
MAVNIMRKLVIVGTVLTISIACSSKSKVSDSSAQNASKKAAATKVQADAAKSTTAASSVTCTHNSEKRTIAVQAKDSGCEVMYTKMGETKSIATAAHGDKYCQGVVSKIQKNLTGAGYSCQ